jgi:hypothetical protein
MCRNIERGDILAKINPDTGKILFVLPGHEKGIEWWSKVRLLKPIEAAWQWGYESGIEGESHYIDDDRPGVSNV